MLQSTAIKVALGSIVTLLVAVFTLLWPAPWNISETKATRDFLIGPGALWAMSWILLAAIAGAAIVWGLHQPSMAGFTVGSRVWIVVALFLVFAPTIYAAIVPSDRPAVAEFVPVDHYKWKFWILFGACALASLAFLLRLTRLQSDAEKITEPKTKGPIETDTSRAKDIKTLLLLSRELRDCLLGLGALLTFVIVSQATLRLALEAIGKKDVMQLQQVLSYSLYYCFVLLIVYVPVHLRLTSVAQIVVDSVYALDKGRPHEVLKQRDDTLRLIGLSGDWPEVLRSGVIVISPLLAALFAQALPK